MVQVAEWVCVRGASWDSNHVCSCGPSLLLRLAVYGAGLPGGRKYR